MARYTRIGALALVCALASCSTSGPPSIPAADLIPFAAPDLVNPLRGQYENLLIPLFPQVDPAQREFEQWPGTNDVSARIDWRTLQPRDPRTVPPDAPDDQRFDFTELDRAIDAAARDGRRFGFRITAFNSCCETSYPNNVDIAVPDWLRAVDGATRGYDHDGVTYVIPQWNDPGYLSYFTSLLEALGRRYDLDERVALFEMSGYGDFSENHVAFMRDTLGIPGPNSDNSEAELGYLSQFADQYITKQSIDMLVTANLAAFPTTQLITTMGNAEIIKQLFRDNALVKNRRKPVGIRADGLGVYRPVPVWAEQRDSPYVQARDPIIGVVVNRYRIAPIVTEWIPSVPAGVSITDYYLKGLYDVVNYHVSMTASTGFPAQTSGEPMSAGDFAIWARANKFSGYRYAVTSAGPPEQKAAGDPVRIPLRWTNHGVAPTYERWVPTYDIVSASGEVVRTLTGSVDLHSLVADQRMTAPTALPASASTESTLVVDDLPRGTYTVRVRVEWQEHKDRSTHTVDFPPMQLAQSGRDAEGNYLIAEFAAT